MTQVDPNPWREAASVSNYGCCTESFPCDTIKRLAACEFKPLTDVQYATEIVRDALQACELLRAWNRKDVIDEGSDLRVI